MPTALSYTFTTLGATNSVWNFTTEPIPPSEWSLTTVNASSEWSFGTATADSIWSFKTVNNDSNWSFSTADISDSDWSFTTINQDSIWLFTVAAEGEALSTLGEVFYTYLDSKLKVINITVKGSDLTSNTSFVITNLRTNKETIIDLTTITYTPTVSDFDRVYSANFKHTIDTDGVYKVTDITSGKVLGYLLVNPNNCLFEYAHKHINDNCLDCNELNRLTAVNSVIETAFEYNDFKLVHLMMNILDDICEDCKIC